MRTTPTIALLLVFAAVAVAGDDITARIKPAVIYADQPVEVVVEFGEVEGTITGLELQAPEGFKVEGWREAGRQMTVVGGKRRDIVTYIAVVHPPAGKQGRFTLGPLVVIKEDDPGCLQID